MAKNQNQPQSAKAFLDQTAKASEKEQAKESEKESEKASEGPKADQVGSKEVEAGKEEAKAEKPAPEVPGKFRKFAHLMKGKK